ncbi:MAG: DinB family protein [Pyrinomonadaceae bacterium]|nr:DinB family protein [Pyrinomonadaceae bacterium]
MMNENIGKPDTTEYLPYYGRYVSLVPDGDILTVLGEQAEETAGLLNSIPESRANFRYAPDKWSIKELVGHLIDCERIFAYRALRFARNDQTPLSGFEQDDYVSNASFDSCRLADLSSELRSVRQSTILLFKHLDTNAWMRSGLANDSEASVRALAHIIAGHELHHRQILRTRYLPAMSLSEQGAVGA